MLENVICSFPLLQCHLKNDRAVIPIRSIDIHSFEPCERTLTWTKNCSTHLLGLASHATPTERERWSSSWPSSGDTETKETLSRSLMKRTSCNWNDIWHLDTQTIARKILSNAISRQMWRMLFSVKASTTRIPGGFISQDNSSFRLRRSR